MFDAELARRRAEKQRRASGGAVEGGTSVAPDEPMETPAPARRSWPSGIDASIPAGDRDDDPNEDDEWVV
jgi:hypothetical protein